MPDAVSAQGIAVPGSVSVSETGAARYSIPIAVPPGTAGMVPSISISYNSQAGNGVVGVGFGLEGLAAIGRCPKTMATDGERGTVNFDAEDRFCLDGQRLIAISGDYGADGTEYRTEIESFSKVISHGSAGTGPAWFEVRTKSGQRMEFGNSADSRVLAQGKAEARLWSVNKVSDTVGNYYTVTYVNDTTNGQAYPDRIDYTGNDGASLEPYNSVRFVYNTNRPDVMTAYRAGSMMRTTVLLTNVQTYAGEALVSDYQLAYVQGTSTHRSQLTSITICEAGGQCLPETSFTWQQGTTEFTTVENVGGLDGTLTNYRPYLGDFNGDGITDILWDQGPDAAYPYSGGERVLWLLNGNEVQVENNFAGRNGELSPESGSTPPEWARGFYPYVVDFNRDGMADVFWYREKTKHRISLINGDEITVNGYSARWVNKKSHYESTPMQAPPGTSHYIFGSGPPVLDLSAADINADSRADVIWHSQTSTLLTTWMMLDDGSISISDLITPSDSVTSGFINPKTKKIPARLSQADFNGDGVSDILWRKGGNKGIKSIWIGVGDSSYIQNDVTNANLDDYTPHYIDINSDGLTDILWDKVDSEFRSNGERIVWISKGDGTFIESVNPANADGSLAQHVPAIADYNSDGYGDIIWFEVDSSGRATGSYSLWQGRPDGTFISISSANDASIDGYSPILGDFNGDGKSDILWDQRNSNDTRSKGTRLFWLSDGEAPDLLVGVTNGLGASLSLTYKPFTDSTIYIKDNDASDPVIDLQMPMHAVSRLEQSDGIGGVRATSYSYAGAKAHLDGRGFLGVREFNITDEQTGTVQSATYRQDYPFTGLVANETTIQDGVTLSSTVNTHAETDLGGPRRQVTITESFATGADLNGAPLPSTTTSYQYDAFGNATEIAVTTSDGFSKATTNSYANDTTNWLLGRLLTATVSNQVPALDAQAPIADTTPDPLGFTDVTDATPNTLYESSAVVSGINRIVTATVTGGDAQIRKNGAGAWTSSVQVSPGELINIRMTSGSAYGAVVAATVTVGGVSSNWTLTAQQSHRMLMISESTNNFNLRTYHDSLYPPPVDGELTPISVTAIIELGVIIGSDSTSTPAFDVGDWPSGVTVTVNVKGRIQGAGGDGGSTLEDGSDGGTALYCRYPINVTLNEGAGAVWAGGGGGGGGGRYGFVSQNRGGGGGGGAGQIPGVGATGYGNQNGQPGTTETGGQGHSNRAGDGGDPGQSGQSGSGSDRGVGGAAGLAIDGVSFITKTGIGDIRGSEVN